jgi:hypothetical protein
MHIPNHAHTVQRSYTKLAHSIPLFLFHLWDSENICSAAFLFQLSSSLVAFLCLLASQQANGVVFPPRSVVKVFTVDISNCCYFQLSIKVSFSFPSMHITNHINVFAN